jgi:hypothetical protein
MATQITCIVPDSSDPDRRIDAVGGAGWQKSEDDVIEEIDGGRESYFVEVGGEKVDVVVAERGDTKYLRTDPDKTTANNLLSLPPCP